jgi:hypothetical protein
LERQRWGWFGGFEYEQAAVGEDDDEYAHPLLDKDQIVRFFWASGNPDDWRTLGQTEVRLMVFFGGVFSFIVRSTTVSQEVFRR